MAKWIETYNHNGKVGVLVEFFCNSDFSIKTDEFREFALDIAMQIAACRPIDVEQPTSADIISIQSREKSESSEISDTYLLNQLFVKDPDRTVRDIVMALNERLSEKIHVIRFERYE